MMSKLQNPMVAAMAGIMISVALGVYMVWQVAAQAISALPHAAGPLEAKPAAVETARGWDFWTIEIENVSNELRDERARLRQESERIEQRAARVQAEADELSRVRAEVERLRGEIAGKLIEIKEDEAKNLKTLAQTYSNLTPKATVPILRELDDVTAVKILSLMKPDVVAPVFEEMGKSSASDPALAKRAAAWSNQLRLMKARPANPNGGA